MEARNIVCKVEADIQNPNDEKSSLKIHFFLIYVKLKKNVCYEGAEIMKYICLIFIMFGLQYMYC